MILSKRLMAVAEMVTPGKKLADVGTDHGYIPIYLVENQIIPYAVAMDIHKGPLERACENIEKYNLNYSIKTKLSDGLSALNEQVEAVVIAGMGGSLMINILHEGKDKLSGISELILSPHSEICEVRQFLHSIGFKIMIENMVIDEGKFYTILKAVPGIEIYSKNIYYIYGKHLLINKNPALKNYLEKELIKNQKILRHLKQADSLHARERVDKIMKDIQRGEEALTYYE